MSSTSLPAPAIAPASSASSAASARERPVAGPAQSEGAGGGQVDRDGVERSRGGGGEPSLYAAVGRARRAGGGQAALLACGAAAAIVYVVADVVCALSYPGYDSSAQAISELSAIDAPTQSLWRVFGIVYGVLSVAFAIGLWRSARDNRRVRIVAALLFALALFGAAWPPMHQRGEPTTLTDTLHVVWAAIVSLGIMTAIVFSAGAYGRRFHRFALLALLAMLACGTATFAYASTIAAGDATPWMGVLERANLGAYLVWLAVLSITAVRAARPDARAISETGFRRIGGIEQWVMIRGADRANPPLVMLHGGPGLGETSLFRHFNGELEERFTVVYWDQRGAGKTARRDHSHAPLTVERMLADLDELVEQVRARLGADKVTIFGHSWGSALGSLYAARFPHKVAAYVGSGQLGDWTTSEQASYAYAVAEAERRGEHELLARLHSIGPPPYGPAALWVERNCVARLDGRVKMVWALVRAIIADPQASFLEIPGAMRTFRHTIDAMWDEVSRIDLRAQAPVLACPVFFFLGRRDHWVPPATSIDYFDRLEAPAKRLVWFETSGHEPFVDEPAKFDRAMIELVRPVSAAAAA